MLIYVLNEDLRIITTLKNVVYSQYVQEGYGVGSFTIHVKPDKNKYLLNKQKNFYFLFDKNVFAKLNNIDYAEGDDGWSDVFVLTGTLANSFFEQRIVDHTFYFSGKSYMYIEGLVQTQILSDPERFLNIEIRFKNEELLKQKCATITKQTTGKKLWEEMSEIAMQDHLYLNFFPVVLDNPITLNGVEISIEKWILEISLAEERHSCVFSKMLSNLKDTEYELNKEKQSNVLYIAGEGQGDKRKWYKLKNKNEELKSGWGRKELFVDARDLQSEAEGRVLTQAEYDKLIQQRADEKSEENKVEETYTATLLLQGVNKKEYQKDFNLCDFVRVEDPELGISVAPQVVSYSKTIVSGELIENVEVG